MFDPIEVEIPKVIVKRISREIDWGNLEGKKCSGILKGIFEDIP